MFELLFTTVIPQTGITGASFCLCTISALLIGLFIAYTYKLRGTGSKSYLLTIIMLPAIVEIIILMVNGNLGAGVAVAGTFSLVRFRSAQGSGEEITGIFLAMAAGLASGMGYIGIAVISAAAFALIMLLIEKILEKGTGEEQILRIYVPESLDYEHAFDEVLEKYTDKMTLDEVKTASMGSLYKLTYKIVLKPGVATKALLDDIRIRNGNMEVSCGRPVTTAGEL